MFAPDFAASGASATAPRRILALAASFAFGLAVALLARRLAPQAAPIAVAALGALATIAAAGLAATVAAERSAAVAAALCLASLAAAASGWIAGGVLDV